MISTRMTMVVLAAVPLVVFACGGQNNSAVGDAKLPSGAGSKGLDHQECSESGNKVEVLDTNGDGKPDIRRIYNKGTGREICRIVDLNHDGKPDMYEYYDASGTVSRREYCYDDTAVVNAIEYYDGGKLSRREYDTTGMHKIDTWDWFDGSAPTDPKTGRPTHPSRRERDVTGDGHIDQWWTWTGDTVSIAVDSNGDGKPDPASTINLDKTGQVASADTSGASSAPPPAAPAASSAAPATPPAPAAAGDAGATPAAAADGGKP
jgi:hypothetical protein